MDLLIQLAPLLLGDCSVAGVPAYLVGVVVCTTLVPTTSAVHCDLQSC